MSKQGISFRGHDENISSKNKGNFKQLVNYSQDLKKFITNQNFNCLSPDSQNEILPMI